MTDKLNTNDIDTQIDMPPVVVPDDATPDARFAVGALVVVVDEDHMFFDREELRVTDTHFRLGDGWIYELESDDGCRLTTVQEWQIEPADWDEMPEEGAAALAEMNAEFEADGELGDPLPDMTAHAFAVHRARTKFATLKAELDARTAEFEERNRILIEAVADANLKQSEVEDAARADALEYHRITGDKKLPAGFGIRVGTKYIYNDDDALEWAISHAMPKALKLDKRGFEKLVKAGATDGKMLVEEYDNYTATIPTDLSKHVEDAVDAEEALAEYEAEAAADLARAMEEDMQRHIDDMAAAEEMDAQAGNVEVIVADSSTDCPF